MNELEPMRQGREGGRDARVVFLVLGIVMFALAMNLRGELDERWQRAALTAGAVAALVFGIRQFRAR